MSELMRRYDEARALLGRCQKALCRSGWEEGEKDGEVLDAVMLFLGHEQLEDEHFGAYVPMVKRATGRTIPDLRGREHVCEYQATARAI